MVLTTKGIKNRVSLHSVSATKCLGTKGNAIKGINYKRYRKKGIATKCIATKGIDYKMYKNKGYQQKRYGYKSYQLQRVSATKRIGTKRYQSHRVSATCHLAAVLGPLACLAIAPGPLAWLT